MRILIAEDSVLLRAGLERLLPRTGTAHLDVVLPRSLAPVALDLRSSAGDVTASGRFSTVVLTSSAGDLGVSGSAGDIRLTTSAGNIAAADLDVHGDVVTDASAGDTALSLTSLPSSIRSEGAAGDIRAVLPDGDYRVTTSTSFGDVEQGLRNSPGSDRRYAFETAAGDIELRTR